MLFASLALSLSHRHTVRHTHSLPPSPGGALYSTCSSGGWGDQVRDVLTFLLGESREAPLCFLSTRACCNLMVVRADGCNPPWAKTDPSLPLSLCCYLSRQQPRRQDTSSVNATESYCQSGSFGHTKRIIFQDINVVRARARAYTHTHTQHSHPFKLFQRRVTR